MTISQDTVIIIQKADVSDIAQIQCIMESTFGAFPRIEELFTKWITQEHYSVQVARQEQIVVGVSTWGVIRGNDFSKYECFGDKALSFIKNQNAALIINLAILPEYRRNKIGQRLALASLNWSKEQNCSVIFGSSWVSGSDDNSQHLYHKAGFEKLGESKDFMKQQQLQNGATCAVCKTSNCNCMHILYGAKVSAANPMKFSLRSKIGDKI
jgi:ribosomal protein S18 acetylase RimI-like enzyme